MSDSKESSLILIADDSGDNQAILRAILADGNYQFLFASDGEQALMILEQHQVDLVLLDVMMPTLDGIETCRRIRETSALADVPVIMVTALSDRKARLTGIRAGADDFITKPIDEDELRARVRSITRLNRYRRRLEQQQRADFLEYFDPLTRLPNRKRAAELLGDTLTRAAGDSGVAVMVAGIDNFDEISDTLGHEVGDRILQEVGERFGALLHERDTLARLAGAKFVVLLDVGRSPRERARQIGARLRATIRDPFTIGNQSVYLSCCVGIAVGPGDGDQPDQLIANAAAAMNAARAGSGDAQQSYSSSMNVAVLRRLTIENRLRNALAEQRLELRYQPRFDLLNGAITALEAVVCWAGEGGDRHAGGEALADVYYEVADASGLSEPLGAWLLSDVCGRAADWHRQGLQVPRVVVPVGSRLLANAGFVELVETMLQDQQLTGTALELALAEKALRPPADGALIAKLERLRGLGIRLTIDRFGADTLTLAHLARLPVDGLILDPRIVDNLFESISHGAVTKSVVGLAHNLDLFAVAKGVSNDEQRTFLLSWRCDEAQGGLFEPPLPAAALAGRLQQRGSPMAGPVSVEVQEMSNRLASRQLAAGAGQKH